MRTIKDLGLQFDFVSSEQVEQGSLASGKYKVLILPLSLALSPAEVKNIESFVQAGGVVIADAAAGLMDHHCAWQQNDTVNELFGITAPAANKRAFKPGDGPLVVTDEGARWGLEAKDLSGLVSAEPYITAASGTSLIRNGETDAVITRRIGKGWTIYLNTLLTSIQSCAQKSLAAQIIVCSSTLYLITPASGPPSRSCRLTASG